LWQQQRTAQGRTGEKGEWQQRQLDNRSHKNHTKARMKLLPLLLATKSA